MDRLRKIKAERELQSDKSSGSANPTQTALISLVHINLEPPLAADKKAKKKIKKHSSSRHSPKKDCVWRL